MSQYTLQERIINFAQDAARYWERCGIDPGGMHCTKHNTYFFIPDEPCWQCYNENGLEEIE